MLDTNSQFWYIIMTENVRMVTLHKHDNVEDTIWSIEIDGVDTNVGINELWLKHIRRKMIFDDAVDSIAETLAANQHPITEKEKNQLNKLMQCLT